MMISIRLFDYKAILPNESWPVKSVDLSQDIKTRFQPVTVETSLSGFANAVCATCEITFLVATGILAAALGFQSGHCSRIADDEFISFTYA